MNTRADYFVRFVYPINLFIKKVNVMTAAVVDEGVSALEIAVRRLFPGLPRAGVAELVRGIEQGQIQPSPVIYENNGVANTRLAWIKGFTGLPAGGTELLAQAMSSSIRSASWIAMLRLWSLK